MRRWSLAKAGEGQVVLLSGEAGIGKSRLTAALMDRIAAEPLVRLRYFGSSQRADSAFHPIRSQLERAARFSREDDPKTKLDKLDELLAQTETSRADAGLLAEMLDLANDGRYPSTELSPQRRRHDTLTALVRQIEALSRKSPTLMVFEDAHWSDPSSLEEADRAGLGDAFKARGDIDPVAHQIAVGLFDHVAQMNADPELNAALGRQARIALDHRSLDFNGAVHRVDDTPELDNRRCA